MAENRNKNTNKKAVPTRKSRLIIWILVAVVILASALVAGGIYYGNSKDEKSSVDTKLTASYEEKSEKSENNEIKENKEEIKVEENVKVLVEMENGGEFVLELYPEFAPQTVQNFVDLVTDGFYDGVGFHRVVDGFMAQGGDPEGTGMGGSGVNIPGEFAANGFVQNTLSHTRGVISMARSQHPDSASSQFFICYDDASFLDGNYAAFGKVVEGMEVVDGFLDVERTFNMSGEQASPVEPIVMKSVTIIE